MANRVLVIDDEELIRCIMKRALEKGDFDVTVCGSGAEAMVCVAQKVPDLIISDYNLQEYLNGVDLANDIRRVVRKRIPTIIMSARPENKEKAEANFFEYIEKPFCLEQLRSLIAKCLPTPYLDERSENRKPKSIFKQPSISSYLGGKRSLIEVI